MKDMGDGTLCCAVAFCVHKKRIFVSIIQTDMKRILFALLAFVPFSVAMAQGVNDSNTPLHLMKPDYSTPYVVPSAQEVKDVMDRVFRYIDNNTPMIVEDNTSQKPLNNYRSIEENSRLRRGSFRLTSYEWGVTYSAMLRATEVTGDKTYRDYAMDRMQFLADIAPYFKKIADRNREIDPLMRQVVAPAALDDAGAIGAAMIKAQIVNRNLNLKGQIELRADYVINRQQRLSDGNFARMRPQANTVWLDDMFMGLPIEALYSKYLRFIGKSEAESRSYEERAANDFLVFSNRMYVPSSGLYRHGWVEGMSVHPSFYWARANGWALLTACELLDCLPEETEGYGEIKKRFLAHMQRLAELQGHNGFWHQLLDRSDTYEETSATAIYAYCMAHAINKGWADPMTYGPIAVLAWNAVSTKVSAQGLVEGTCVGTGMAFDASFYAYRPVHSMAAHGYGPVLWAGAEIIEMLRRTHPKMNDSAVHFYPEQQDTDAPIFEVKR